MIQKLTNILKKLINRLIHLYKYIILVNFNKYKLDVNTPILFIDLKDRRFDVYYSCLLHFFQEAGYQLVFNKANILFIGNDGGYFKYIHEFEKKIYFPFKGLTALNLKFDYITDNKEKVNHVLISKLFNLNYNYFNFNNYNGNKLAVPYPLHPANYFINKQFDKFESFRLNKPKIKIFFSGNTIKESYDSKELKDTFDINSRYEIISYIKNNLNEDKLSIVKVQKEWEIIFQSGFNGLAIIDWYWHPQNMYNMGVKIKADKWLETLSNSSFFLACPGVIMPHSHNIYEAMSVGSIPIVQFGHLFYPPLQHNVNAILYSDLEDLNQKIDEVIKLSENEIAIISNNVIKYFEENCTPKAFMNNINLAEDGNVELFLNVEFVSYTEFKKTNS